MQGADIKDEEPPAELGEPPRLEGDPEDTKLDVPKPFTKLHRRAGDRWGLYLAETKNRFVVSDGQREVFGLLALMVFVEVGLMLRLTTTLHRRTRRMVQETTRWLCFTSRNEFDLDDVVRVRKQGLGRQARIVAELSGGEEVPLTYASVVVSQEDLKVRGFKVRGILLNNFLFRRITVLIA
jgi:hypothetical protein